MRGGDAFHRELERHAVDARGRRWVYVPYDQLNADIGPLARHAPSEVGVILIEAPAKAARRPYNKQKLAFVLASQRHFALEQARRGVAVRYLVSRDGYASALRSAVSELGAVTMMEAAERELRAELAPLVEDGALRVEPHEGWLTTREDFIRATKSRPPWRMDAFYRHVRRRTGILMRKSQPEGGKWSFDTENRKPWRGTPAPPSPLAFEADAISREVADLVQSRYERHPGRVDLTSLPVTHADAEAAWQWARAACLPSFGAFEDAMSAHSTGLFHTRISALLNNHRLLPGRVVRDVADDARLPIASREGFVRQVLGWREFIRHVHVETDGFRSLPDGAVPCGDGPGDAGFRRWRGAPWETRGAGGDSGAKPSALGASFPLPLAYWGRPSGLNCLDTVVASVWQEGWSHHITRLMVLSNLATLLGVDPRELTDWFWVAYVDAYDWVVEPNVLGMGTFAVSDLLTTKPYVSGAAYIDRMSDYCDACAFDPKTSCPITRLYWQFLAQNQDRLARNPRTAGPIASLAKRPAAERRRDRRTLEIVLGALAEGRRLTAEDCG